MFYFTEFVLHGVVENIRTYLRTFVSAFVAHRLPLLMNTSFRYVRTWQRGGFVPRSTEVLST